jgi:FkbM family methyltransferase
MLKILTKWGNKNNNFVVDRLKLYYRQETTDEKVIDEVLIKNVYQKNTLCKPNNCPFLIEPQDIWLDLGANIGTFALLVLSIGARVCCVEPEPINIKLLSKNLEMNFRGGYKIVEGAVHIRDGIEPLYICQGDYNKYRHTLFKKRGRSSINVNIVNIRHLLSQITAIKMDIEGSEIEILEYLNTNDFRNITKLVYEYSFDFDKSIPRFMSIINKLRKIFKIVYYTKVKEDELEYTYYPPQCMVYCIR